MLTRILSRQNWPLIGLVALSLASTIVVIEVLLSARKLRPIADDYGSAEAMLGGGLLKYISSNYMNFSGELSRVVADAVLVGAPVSYLPWGLSSFLTFVVATLAVLLAFGAVTRLSLKKENQKGLTWAALPIAALGWWAYWWAPVGVSHSPDVRSLPDAITHWQIINSSYVFLVAGALGVWLWAVMADPRRMRLTSLVIAASSVVVGLSGPSLALSALVALSGLLILNVLASSPASARSNLNSLIISMVGVVVGLVISQTSPGTRQRAAYLAAGEGVVPKTPGSLLNWTIPAGFAEWFGGIWNVGALVLLGLAVTVGFLIARLGGPRNPSLVLVGFSLLSFSFVYALVNRLAEAFSYVAFWHQIGFRTVQALAVFALGLAIGAWLSTFQSRAAGLTVASVLIVAALWALSAERLMVGSINDRYAAWNVGPAPLNGMPDIENTDTWVYRSWLVLAEFRGDAPDRGVN